MTPFRLAVALALLFVLVVTTVSVGAIVYFGPAELHEPAPLKTALLLDLKGRELAQIRPDEIRIPIAISQVPKHVQDAYVAAEDHRFWEHRGIDPLAIGNALMTGVGGTFRGASTITQQYVKITFVGNRRELRRKMREAVIAMRLERRYPKKKILEAYLNSIFLGHGSYGIEAAARHYFGRPARELTLAQGALLAGITRAPSRNSPRRHPERALLRRNWVLRRMVALGYVSQAQADRAKAERLELARPRALVTKEPMFTDWVRAELLDRLDEDQTQLSELSVQTTLDLDVQETAKRAVAEVLGRSDDPEVAVVAVHAATGEVRAMVGGRDKNPGEFNLATMARRMAGSSFKPFVLAAALEKGMALDTRYRAPAFVRLRFPGWTWGVRNYNGRGYGYLTLRDALAHSVNTVYARLISDVGSKRVVELGRRLGFGALSTGPTLALGTSGVNALEMAAGFAAFANEGVYQPPTGLHFVASRGDERVRLAPLEPRRAMSSATAAEVREGLQAVIRYGTGRKVKVPDPKAGGKTGTSEDFRDAWFVGIAGGYAIAVWVGYPEAERPMKNVRGIEVVGGSFPATIWTRVAKALLKSGDKPQRKMCGDGEDAPRVEVWASCPWTEARPEPAAEPAEERPRGAFGEGYSDFSGNDYSPTTTTADTSYEEPYDDGSEEPPEEFDDSFEPPPHEDYEEPEPEPSPSPSSVVPRPIGSSP